MFRANESINLFQSEKGKIGSSEQKRTKYRLRGKERTKMTSRLCSELLVERFCSEYYILRTCSE